jgi:hypothetical protein
LDQEARQREQGAALGAIWRDRKAALGALCEGSRARARGGGPPAGAVARRREQEAREQEAAGAYPDAYVREARRGGRVKENEAEAARFDGFF